MHLLGLSSLVLSAALASAPAKPGAPAPAPSRSSATPTPSASTELELEVVERSAASRSSFGFVVPIDGKVEAFIDRAGDPQRCEVEAHPVHTGLRLRLRCDGGPTRSLHVEATRALRPGARVRLAEVSQPGGATHQVFVTLR